MSLNRVASLETFAPFAHNGPSRSVSPSSRDRRLSFNPLPESWDPHAGKPGYIDSVGAFEVPLWKRILQVLAAVIYCLLAAGVVFGYAALKPVLKKEGAYEDVCATPESSADEIDTCVELHLNLMFTVAAVATNVAALPVGSLLDHFGPRTASLLGALFLAAGSLLLAYERSLPFDALLVGYLLLALGGPFTYISAFQLSNAFPAHSGLVLALLTGAFDASSALFLVYRLLFNGGILGGHASFFRLYLVVPLAIILVQLFLMPKQSYKTVGEMVIDEQVDDNHHHHHTRGRTRDDQVDETTALLLEDEEEDGEEQDADADAAEAAQQARKEANANARSGLWGVMHGYPISAQLRSPWFVLICLFTAVQMTRINYFVATVRAQFAALLPQEDAAAVSAFFDVALPVGGLVSVPFVGVLLDRTPTVAVLASLVGVGTAIGMLGVVRGAVGAAYANVGLFVLYRPFYYTAVSDYTAKVFGFRTFGTVYGTLICLSGLLNFSQSGLDYLFHQTFRGDPVPVNLLLLALGVVVGTSLVGYVGWQVRGLKRKMLSVEAERATGLYAY